MVGIAEDEERPPPLISRGTRVVLAWTTLIATVSALVWSASEPSLTAAPLIAIIGILGLVAVALWWLVELVDIGLRVQPDRQVLLHFVVTPVVVAAALWLAFTPIPDRVRFAASRHALDAAAAQAEHGERVYGRVGGYTVAESRVAGGEVTLYLRSGLGSRALVRPNGGTDLTDCSHAGGLWYLCPWSNPDDSSD
jgi:hypothetical protein